MENHWPAWVEINLDNIAHNTKEVKRRIGENVVLMAVVKANAYGHGLIEVAKVALENGAEKLGVTSIEEGIALREKNITEPILILGQVLKNSALDVVKYDLMQGISSLELADALSKAGQKLKKTAIVNIEVNTGMNRFGINPEEVVEFTKKIKKMPNVYIEGIFTHLATSYIEEEFSNFQYRRFVGCIEKLEKEGINIPYKHCANTGCIINFPHMYLNQVRPGVVITTKTKALKDNMDMDLKDSFEFKSRIVFIRKVPKGETVGYNRLYMTEEDSIIAVVAAGWADGVPRELTNKGYVLIGGVRCPIRGRICSDQILVDITKLENIKIGDEVVLIGKQGNQEIFCGEWVKILGGVSSAVTFRTIFTERVKKIYIQKNRTV